MSLEDWQIKTAEESIKLAKETPFFGTDRTIPSTRFNRPYVDERKWYQKIEWLQRLARKIIVD